MDAKILEGVIIGASGGALAGITVYLIQYLHQKCIDFVERRKIYDWLMENCQRDQFRSTRAISSWTNLPVDRVQYLCSHDERIKLSTGDREDMWAPRSRISEPTYE